MLKEDKIPSFTKAYSMYKHQRTAKYCLTLQGKQAEENICNCGKEFSRRDIMLRHQKKCPHHTSDKSQSIQLGQIGDLKKIITKLLEQQATIVFKF